MTDQGVLTTGELARRGWAAGEVRSQVRAGRLVRVRRGAYATTTAAGADGSHRRHRVEVLAAVSSLDAGAVVSHASAAVLHGLQLWRVPLVRVHVTRDVASGGRVHRAVRVRTAPLAPDEVVTIDGVVATSAARTVVDLLRDVGFEQGVVTADAALRTGLVSRASLSLALERARGWPGVPRARRVVAFADARSESVGESRSRVAIARAGLPVPHPQLAVVRDDGVVVGRCDFGWEELGVVGEFDGKVTYGRALLRPDQEPGDAVFEEKLREDALRDAGHEVVRWVWAELRDFAPVVARFERARARAARRRR